MAFLTNLPILIALLFLTERASSSPAGTLVAGGVEATRFEFPFLVHIKNTQWNEHLCGGVIISEDWVLTAGFCTQLIPSAYEVTAGDHNKDSIEGTEQTRQVVEVIRHPSYTGPSDFANNVGLMRVSPPFQFNQYVQPANLSGPGEEPTATATVAGWGENENGISLPVLMKADLPLINQSTCDTVYNNVDILQSMVCYGEGNGIGMCTGDRGGPLMCGTENKVCGLYSSRYGCASGGYPDVYTRVPSFLQWIQRNAFPAVEDTSPLSNVTSCGGYVETTSGTIVLQEVRNCVWTIKVPYDTLRFRLLEIGQNSDVFVTTFGENSPRPESTTSLQLGQDHAVNKGLVLLTLKGNRSANTSLRLEFYSSGRQYSNGLTGLSFLDTSTSGMLFYPFSGGYYPSGQAALIVLSPRDQDVQGDLDIQFTFMDIFEGADCNWDNVAVWEFQNGGYVEVLRHCGITVPSEISLSDRIGFVTFESVTSGRRGFKLTYS